MIADLWGPEYENDYGLIVEGLWQQQQLCENFE